MSKIKIITRPYGNKKFLVYFGKQLMDKFSTKEKANEYAQMYLSPPYTIGRNKWYV